MKNQIYKFLWALSAFLYLGLFCLTEWGKDQAVNRHDLLMIGFIISVCMYNTFNIKVRNEEDTGDS